MRAICSYPVYSMWFKVIKAGNFVGLPLLTAANVNKYCPEIIETLKVI